MEAVEATALCFSRPSVSKSIILGGKFYRPPGLPEKVEAFHDQFIEQGYECGFQGASVFNSFNSSFNSSFHFVSLP